MDTLSDVEMETPRQRWSQLWPFMLAFVLGFALAWLAPQGPENVTYMVVAGVIIVAVAASILRWSWSSVPDILTLLPVAALCVAVDLMRAASGGGSSAGYGSLLLIPVIWQAMRRGQRELVLTIVLVSIANVVAVMVLASPVSAAAQWRSVILFTVVAATIGQTIHRLVQARAELLEHITELARRDALTGLANRRTWDERFPEEVERASRHALPLAVALLDLDHFKAYNDEHGHQRGDALLEAAARSWSEMLRTGDLLARWGGEEFALLMPATDVDEAAVVLERLQDATPEGQTFSAGYTVERFHPGFEPDLDQVLRAVDQAMYVAKASGRARSALAVVAAIRLDEPLSAPLAPAPAPG